MQGQRVAVAGVLGSGLLSLASIFGNSYIARPIR